MRSLVAVLALAMLVVPFGCKQKPDPGPPIPASSDPKGNDLLVGSIVVAHEKTGGVRILKVVEVKYFPPPMTEDLFFIAYNEKGNDFKHAARLWKQGGLTVALPRVQVQRHMFAKRNYRIIAQQPVTDADRNAKRQEQKK